MYFMRYFFCLKLRTTFDSVQQIKHNKISINHYSFQLYGISLLVISTFLTNLVFSWPKENQHSLRCQKEGNGTEDLFVNVYLQSDLRRCLTEHTPKLGWKGFCERSEQNAKTVKTILTAKRGKKIMSKGAGMAQWWQHSPPTNVARVLFADPASYVGWVCCWFSFLLRGFFSGFSGFPPSTKTNTSKFQFDRDYTAPKAYSFNPHRV